MRRDSPILSEQATSILRQFVESGGNELIYRDFGQGQFAFQVDNLRLIDVTEPRFIQEDLDQLTESALLAIEFGPDGHQIYHLTRKSAHYLDSTALSASKNPKIFEEKSTAGMKPNSGMTVGQWVLQEVIGEGGNGVVWSANDSNNDKVAIKFLKEEHFGQQREQRFRDEIEFLRLESTRPGILPLIDYGFPDDQGLHNKLWFSTPFALCLTNLELAGPLNLEKLVTYINAVAHTLAELHRERKWHRDLKPENLFLLNEVPVIGDFGLVDFPGKVSHTRESENLGSRNYTAPELEGSAAAVPAGPADVYSLAKTLWVLASGKRHPPPGHLRMDTADLRLSHVCQHLRSRSLDHLLERATNHLPESRPTMDEFARELSEWLNPPAIAANAVLPLFSQEHKRIFEIESRERRQKEEFVNTAKAALRSFEPALEKIAEEVRSSTLLDPQIGIAFGLESEQFKIGYGSLRVSWSGSREVRATVGDIQAAYLQSFVLVEAIEDNSIRIIAGHFVGRTAYGEPFYGGVNSIWKKELRVHYGSAELQNTVETYRVEILNNLGTALQKFAEEVATLKSMGK